MRIALDVPRAVWKVVRSFLVSFAMAAKNECWSTLISVEIQEFPITPEPSNHKF